MNGGRLLPPPPRWGRAGVGVKHRCVQVATGPSMIKVGCNPLASPQHRGPHSLLLIGASVHPTVLNDVFDRYFFRAHLYVLQDSRVWEI